MNALKALFAPQPKLTSVEIAALIHKDVDESAALICGEPKVSSQLVEAAVSDERYNTLIRMGFVNSAPVKRRDAEKIIPSVCVMGVNVEYREMRLARSQIKTYPNLKFITEPILDAICEKWGLIYAPVFAYTGDIPQKNLMEIAQAPVLIHIHNPVNGCMLQITEFHSDCPRSVKKYIRGWMEMDEDVSGREERFIRRMAVLRYAAKMGYNGGYDGNVIENYNGRVIEKQGLFIAAAPSEFNKTALEGFGKFAHMKVDKFSGTEDPIVFRFCKEGVQVISKWGPEAAEPLLVDENKN